MKSRIFIHLIFFILALFTIGCSGNSSAVKEKIIVVKPVKLSAWVDLMPGKVPSMYITGEALLVNNTSKSVKNISFKKAEVYQKDLLLFDFIPKVKLPDKSGELMPNDTVKFYFKNPKGLPLKSGFDFNNVINIIITLTFDSENSEFIFKDVKVEKVY